MEEKIYYRNKIIKAVIFAAISAVIVIAIAMSDGMQFGGALTIGIFTCGIPTGWSIISKIFGKWVIGNIGLLACYLLLKVILSVIVGGIVFPISLIYYITKYILIVKAEKKSVYVNIEETVEI